MLILLYPDSLNDNFENKLTLKQIEINTTPTVDLVSPIELIEWTNRT